MHLHEYQVKRFFHAYGIPVPEGDVLDTAGAATEVARSPGGSARVVKVQVHAGRSWQGRKGHPPGLAIYR